MISWGGKWRLLGVVALGSPAVASAQRAEIGAGRAIAQVATATVVTPIAFFGAGWATERWIDGRRGEADENASGAAYPVAYTATWLAAATPPALIGRGGRYRDALLGSAAGMAAAYGVVKLGNLLYDDDRRKCGVLCWSLGSLVVALPGIGATLLYNGNRR